MHVSPSSYPLVHTHMYSTHVVQNLYRICGGAVGEQRRELLGCDKPAAQPVPAPSPRSPPLTLLAAAVRCPLCVQREARRTQRGPTALQRQKQLVDGRRPRVRERRAERLGSSTAPRGVAPRNECHKSRWGLTGGSRTGGALGLCEAGAGHAPESACGGPSALAPGLLFTTRPRLGSQKPLQSCQVLQRLIQTT